VFIIGSPTREFLVLPAISGVVPQKEKIGHGFFPILGSLDLPAFFGENRAQIKSSNWIYRALTAFGGKSVDSFFTEAEFRLALADLSEHDLLAGRRYCRRVLLVANGGKASID